MTSLRLKRGTTTQHITYTGPPGELTMDTTGTHLRLHDGTTVGGVAVGSLIVTSVKTSAYNAKVNELIRIDSTSGGFTITLPASPSDGDKIAFLDVANKCGTNPVLVSANGKTILGDSTGINLDANGAGLSLMFNNLTNDWSKINMFSSSFAVVDTAPQVTYVDDVFSAYTYTGNGSSQTINNGINLTGNSGLVWIKHRTSATFWNVLFDTLRGGAQLSTNNTDAQLAQANNAAGHVSFNSNGFTTQTGSSGYGSVSASTAPYISWTFRKAPKFFDVVTYTGTNSARTINHNLGIAPGMILIKKTSGNANWVVYHRDMTSAQYVMFLNATNSQTAQTSMFNSTAPTSTAFTVGGDPAVNESGQTYVAYLFAHDSSADGMIQCGSFTTDGSGNATVNLGWEPQYLLYKCSSGTGGWILLDTMRGWTTTGQDDKQLSANLSDAEANTSQAGPTATGFVMEGRNTSATYIYMAIRRPNKPPTLGTQVYNAIARTGTGAAATVTGVGFAPDLVMVGERNSSETAYVWDRLRGTSAHLRTQNTSTERSASNTILSYTPDGLTLGVDSTFGGINFGSRQYINWFFKRSLGVFDIVCYTGTGSVTTVSHNLGVAPELMIVKSRSFVGQDWPVFHSGIGLSWALFLDLADAKTSSPWGLTASASSLSWGSSGDPVNRTSTTYVAYLFATKAGISKVGSYTGNGTSLTINCEFTTGARFILIKRTDSTGDWYVWDTTRGIVSGNDPHLSLNTTNAEVTTDDSVDPDNSGFIVNQVAATNINVNAGTYIFLAIA
jgi:hypothetical protein